MPDKATHDSVKSLSNLATTAIQQITTHAIHVLTSDIKEDAPGVISVPLSQVREQRKDLIIQAAERAMEKNPEATRLLMKVV